MLVPALGGPERRLYLGSERSKERYIDYVFQQPLSWSADGKGLAVTESSIDAPDRIHWLSVESGEIRTVVSSQSNDFSPYSIDYRNPRVSPTSDVLAYNSQGSNWSRIYIVPLVSGEPVQLISRNDPIVGMDWTADGREIIFSSDGFLWRISASGGNPERLAQLGGGCVSPAVARRGSSLAYAQGQLNANIWRLQLPPNSSAKPIPELLISSTRNDSAPQFATDGKRIVFVSTRSGTQEIWVSEADGSNARQVTSSGTQQPGSPRWSPDGQSIVFDQIAEGNKDIYVVSVHGGKPKRLTTEASDEVRPSWSRDGQWIYFGSIRSGQWQIWKVPAAGGQAVQVTKSGGREAFESPDRNFVFYTRAATAPGLWKVPAEGGKETLVLEGPIQGFWAMTHTGVYFLVQGTTRFIKFYGFAAKQTSEVAIIGKEAWFREGTTGFSVSPDGRQILYTHTDPAEYDLMLVENFR